LSGVWNNNNTYFCVNITNNWMSPRPGSDAKTVTRRQTPLGKPGEICNATEAEE